MNRPVISVHTPKVAGTSFLQQLKRVYGEDLYLDYLDDPVNLNSKWIVDPYAFELNPVKSITPYRVVHGHFNPRKYDALDSAFRLTFLRHPVDLVKSIYRFWGAHKIEQLDGPIFKYFKQNKLTFDRFAMLPKIRFLYTDSYFGGFDMKRFDFVGDYHSYNTELFRLQGLLNVKFDLDIYENKTTDIEATEFVETSIERYESFVHDALKDDILFYEKYAGKV